MLNEFIDNLITICLEVLYFISNLLFGWFSLPPFPQELTDSINSFFSIIFDNLSLLGLIIRPTTFFIALGLLVLYFNFEIVYKVVMWLIRKIPFFNIK